MKIFVTGATGFIGKSLVGELIRKNNKVYCLVRPGLLNKERLFEKKVLWIIGDITNADFIKRCPRDIDCVIHLAALIPHGKYTKDDYYQVNCKGTENVVKYFLGSKAKRFIHISSIAVFKPDTDYSITKLKAEKIVERIASYEREYVIIRPTIAYGPGDTRPAFLSLFRYINRCIFLPLGRGENYFHTIYVDNLIQAIQLAMVREEAKNNNFIIGDVPCSQMKDIYRIVYRCLGKNMPFIYCPIFLAKIASFLGSFIPSFPITKERVGFLTSSKVYNIDKTRELLGYNPKVGLSQGMKKTYFWYKKNNLL